MKVVIGVVLGFGPGLIAGGLIAVFSPMQEAVTNVALIALGAGLLAGGDLAAVVSARPKAP